jgi:hypothetical protein
MKPSEILKDIKKKPHNTYCGICYNFEHHPSNIETLELYDALNELNLSITQWPKYSGWIRFPIPHNKHKDSENAYDVCDKWSKKSKYGRLRYELLDWLIEQFESKGA